jgi:hypothetical protein
MTTDVTVERVHLTSEEAAEWLQRHEGPNRRIAEGRTLQYQSDMENGRWHFDAMPIRISNEGKLLDGQHRLTALANCLPPQKVEFLVIRGLDPDSQLVMDQGGTRTAGQQLGIRGVKDANVVASMSKSYLDWKNSRLFSSSQRAGTTKPEAVEWALEHQDLIHKVFETDFRKVDAPASVVGAFALATIQFAPNRTREFLSALAQGAGLEDGSPILALDRRLRNIRRTRVKVSHREYLAYFIRSWNAWVSQNTLTKVQIGSLTEDNFPRLLRAADLRLETAATSVPVSA